MQDSVYNMTLKSYLISDFRIKTSRFRHKKVRSFYGRQRITLPGNFVNLVGRLQLIDQFRIGYGSFRPWVVSAWVVSAWVVSVLVVSA